MFDEIPSVLHDALYHGSEEIYLEYKGDIPWSDHKKKIEIIKTILSLANEQGGGIIVIGVADDGKRVGLSEENNITYSHDTVNTFLNGKTNQPIQCKVSKIVHVDTEDQQQKRFIFIQVSEVKEFPVIYTGDMILKNNATPAFLSNIAVRKGGLYVRNKTAIGNKEIETTEEWQRIIERTYRKYEQETIRRSGIATVNDTDSYNSVISI